MNFLATLFAVAVSSSTPVQAGTSCAAQLLSQPGCTAEQTMGLSAHQIRRINAIRSQTGRSLASLDLQLRRVNQALINAQYAGATPLQLRRLRRQKASLLSQIKQQQRHGTSLIHAVLTPIQRRYCGAAPAPAGHAYAPRKGKVRVRPKHNGAKVVVKVQPKRKNVRVTAQRPKHPTQQVKQPPKHGPYATKRTARRAPPSATKIKVVVNRAAPKAKGRKAPSEGYRAPVKASKASKVKAGKAKRYARRSW